MSGHSLGEYSALVAAGSLGFADAARLVAHRGQLMQQAVPAGTGAMAAVLNLDDDELTRVCDAAAQGQVVSCANFNSPGQIVIAGDKEAVDRACTLALEAGARRAVPLPVSVPSHCLLMKPAADGMETVLQGVHISSPSIPVIHNVDVNSTPEPDGIRAALVQQLWQPVLWSATIQRLIDEGVGRFAECGPGKVLAGLNRRICRDVTTAALVDAASLTETQTSWSAS